MLDHATPPPAVTEPLDALCAAVLDGRDVVVSGAPDGGRALLDEAVPALARVKCRVLRVDAGAPGGLSLAALIGHLAGEPDLEAQDDGTLERGFQALTEPGAEHARIALLVSDAGGLQPAALRYLDFAGRTGPDLHLAFATGAADPAESFGPLQARLADAQRIVVARPAAPPAIIIPPALAAPQILGETRIQPVVAAPTQRGRRAAAWAGIALGMAASAAFGVAVGRRSVSLPAAPVLAAQQAPAPPTPEPAPPAAGLAVQPAPVAAQVDPPPPAPVSAPSLPAATPPVVAPVAAPAATQAPPPPLAAQHAAEPAPAPLPTLRPASHPAVSRPSGPPRPTVATRTQARPAPDRPDPARNPAYWPPQAYDAPPGYPAAPRPSPYIGTYVPDGTGVRTFRYGP